MATRCSKEQVRLNVGTKCPSCNAKLQQSRRLMLGLDYQVMSADMLAPSHSKCQLPDRNTVCRVCSALKAEAMWDPKHTCALEHLSIKHHMPTARLATGLTPPDHSGQCRAHTHQYCSRRQSAMCYLSESLSLSLSLCLSLSLSVFLSLRLSHSHSLSLWLRSSPTQYLECN